MSESFANRSWFLSDETQTRAAGMALGHALVGCSSPKAMIVTLQGDLGAGKTTLVSALLHGMGHVGQVPSPTYTLIEPYELAGRNLFHLDLYRLTDPQQLEDLGWRDLLQPGAILFVEWPERVGGYLPTADLSVRLDYPDGLTSGRQLVLKTNSESLQRLVDSLSF